MATFYGSMELGRKLREARESNGLTIKQVAKAVNIDNSTLCRYEKGERKLPHGLAKDLAPVLGLDLKALYKEIDSYGAEYSKIKSAGRWLPIACEVNVTNPDAVNDWFSKEVMKKKPPSWWDSEKVAGAFSEVFSSAPKFAITYPPHPLALNTHLIRTYQGLHSSLSLECDTDLTHYYRTKGPRFLFMGGSGSETWPVDIAVDLASPITAQDDEKARLARKMLENRRQFEAAFRAQVGKWLHLDICPMSAIQRFIRHGEIARDSWLPYLGANPLTTDHVDRCLTNVIGLLGRYEDTYYIALLDDINYPHHPLVKHIWQDFWAVKVGVNGQSAMFWEEWPFDPQGIREVDHRLDEVDIIKRIVEVFAYLWQCAPTNMLMTDKGDVIKYLKNQCDELPASFNS